jgi:hypothetical protein
VLALTQRRIVNSVPGIHDDDENPYAVPLEALTGRHTYARSLGADDDDPEPGATVAYVAETLKPRPSPYTVEGTIALLGDAADGALRSGGWRLATWRLVAIVMVGPLVGVAVARITGIWG